MSDEHNPFYSSVYGHPFIHTPNMERLAKMGTLYENAYCNSPLCSPSRSAFMAGKPVHQLQTYNNCNVLSKHYASYGRMLRDQGVYTVHAGKADVWNHTDELGFSETISPGNRTIPGDDNFQRKPLTIRKDGADRAKGYGPKNTAFKGAENIVHQCIDWIKGKGRELEQPWTLAINIGPPHFPHYVTPELWEMYPNGGDLPKYGVETASANHPYARDLREHFQMDTFSEADIRGLRRGYLGCVTYVDQQIGKLLDVLEETGQIDDTVFIYTSDHGEMLGKFGMWWKCSMYEDSVRIPLIVAGPGFEKNTKVKTPVSLFDVQAAIFQAVGKIRPHDWWGTPLQEISSYDEDRAVFSEYHGHGTRSSSYMVRKGKWKLIYHMEAPHQLFDLEQDPDELENVAEKETNVLKEMELTLLHFCSPHVETERAFQHEKEQIQALQRWNKIGDKR